MGCPLFKRFVLLLVALTAARSSLAVTVASPDGSVRATVLVGDDGRLSYRIDRGDGGVVLRPSPLGATIDGVDLGDGVELGDVETTSADERYPWRGVHGEARNHFEGAVIDVRHLESATDYQLELRVFDDGVAYRYIVPLADDADGGAAAERTIGQEASAWRLPAECDLWTQPETGNYEGVYQKTPAADLQADAVMGFPVTVCYADGTYGAITEAGAFYGSGMSGRAGGDAMIRGVFEDDESWQQAGDYRSAWRVMLTGPSLNDLVNSDVVPNLCPPPSQEIYPDGLNTEWIKPGRSLWNWWSNSSVGFEEQKPWIDHAGKMGMDYHLVDAGWEEAWSKEGGDKWDLLRQLCEYAAERGVGVQVWKNHGQLHDQRRRRRFFERCADAGVVAVKIDYMNSESREMMRFYTDTLLDAARVRLMVNFHGANKPTGEARTFPNEMTREGIRGLEYNKWDALPADHYASLPFTRYLAGHGDFTPCTFTPDRLKGTTVALQLATGVVYTSPILHWVDRWERYEASPAVEVLKQIPSVWDETRVLPGSEIGRLAAFARRSGDTWFIGVINGGDEREFAVDLSMLGPGTYDLTTVRDVAGQPARMTVDHSTATAEDTLEARLNKGGGVVAMLAKQ